MGHKTSILIVESSDIILEGLKHCLEGSSVFNVLSPLHDAQSLAERLAAAQPDVLLLNPTLLSPPSRMLVTALLQQRPHMVAVALVYQYVDPDELAVFHATLDIHVPCNKVAALLQETYDNAQEDNVCGSDDYELSDRETSILVLVAKGLSSKEIAEKLHISVHTVSTHRKNITHKTGIKSVAGLAVYAMLHNLM